MNNFDSCTYVWVGGEGGRAVDMQIPEAAIPTRAPRPLARCVAVSVSYKCLRVCDKFRIYQTRRGRPREDTVPAFVLQCPAYVYVRTLCRCQVISDTDTDYDSDSDMFISNSKHFDICTKIFNLISFVRDICMRSFARLAGCQDVVRDQNSVWSVCTLTPMGVKCRYD